MGSSRFLGRLRREGGVGISPGGPQQVTGTVQGGGAGRSRDVSLCERVGYGVNENDSHLKGRGGAIYVKSTKH